MSMRGWLIVGLLMLAVTSAAAAVDLRLGEHDFEWTSVEKDRAGFRWWAMVANDTSRAFDVEVVLELLDEGDQIVHRDAVTIAVGGDTAVRAGHEGSMPFDRAADVALFRFRLNPSPPDNEDR